MERATLAAGPILVPLDGSEAAERALDPAAHLARILDRELLLAQVLPITTWAFATPDAFTRAEAYQELLEEEELRAYAYLTALAERLRADGLPVTVFVTRGVTAPTLLSTVANFSAGLIVMTTHGRSGVGRVVLGSVADHIVRHGEVPVLLIRATAEDSVPACLARAVVPLDGSQVAESALHVLYPWLGRLVVDVELVRVVASGAYGEERIAAEEYLWHQQHKLTKHVPAGTTCTVTHMLHSGHAADEILRAARQHHALVVMATHGYSGFQRLRLGSVAERVVHEAVGPVLLVRGVASEQSGHATAGDVATVGVLH